jgi:hypothetical protein
MNPFNLPEKMSLRSMPQSEFSGSDMAARRHSQIRLLVWAMVVMTAVMVVTSGTSFLELIADVLETAFELLEGMLEDFYRKVGRMDLRHAQMASAYTYLVVAIVLAATLGRRAMRLSTRLCQRVRNDYQRQAERMYSAYRHYEIFFSSWWESLDGLNKLAALVGALLGLVPLLLLLSYAIGAVVAELI